MKKMELGVLRALLFVVALTGLIGTVDLFISWGTTVGIMERLGISGMPPTSPSPLIEYWLRMMAAVGVVVGYLYLVAALNPGKYKNVLPILGWGLILIGITAGYHGFRLGLPPWPFYGDLGICAVCGPGIVWLSRRV